MSMQDCDEIRDRLIDFIEGERTAEERREIAVHLFRCPQCSGEAVELREALARVRALPEPLASAHLLDGFAAAVQARLATERPPCLPFWRKVPAWLGGFVRVRPIPAFSAAAVLGLLLVIGLVRLPGRPQVSPVPEVLVVGESLSIAQNLDVLEQFDLLEDLDLLEQLPLLRGPGNGRTLTLS
jgi:anti-sigma factor RsiW